MTEIWAITITSLFCRHLPWLKNWRTWQHRKKKPRQRHPRKGRALTCITFSPNVLLGMIEISPTQQQSSTFDHDLAVVKYSTIKPLENSRLYCRRVGKLCPWIIICHFLLNHKSPDLLTAYQGLCTNFTSHNSVQLSFNFQTQTFVFYHFCHEINIHKSFFNTNKSDLSTM